MKRKKTRKPATLLSKEKKLEIATFIVNHPDLTINRIARSYGVSYFYIWRIIEEFIDVKKTLSLKATEKPTE